MKKKYNILELSEKDTLFSVSKELQKPVDEIAGFHNIFATSDCVIGTSFPKNLKQLYVPSTINIREVKREPKVNFSYGSFLNLMPTNKENLYQIEKEIIQGTVSYKFNFQVGIKLIKKTGDDFIFRISKLNKEKDLKTDTILYNLLEELEQVYYPLELHISKSGCVSKIKNHKQILQNWKEQKIALYEKYQGDVVINYLDYYEKNISNKEVLEKLLMKDIFFTVYFNALYENYSTDYFFEKEFEIPVFSKCKHVNYLVNQKINPYLSKKGKVEIEIKGKAKDERTQLDFESNLDHSFFMPSGTNPVVTGDLKIKYQLNAITHSIDSVFFECDLQLEKYKKVRLTISSLNE
ncbi:hypothetical protein [Flavobacterium sp. J27]|uniref:hypothetical protein n=1 Tax=Flavobacterium sp. J27 TaxID=2060419 RepID=UPI0010304353|nr:hypothetical protein [Flavobacterium sp. J27]